MPLPFLPGLELSRALYADAVAPLLARHLPGLPHSAARLGSGSEVLGLDTPRSADHEWGPRLQLFLHEDDLARHGARVDALLSAELPTTVRGWSTHFGPADAAVRTMQPADGPVRHRVDVVSVGGWSDAVLGFDARHGPTTFDWLATPSQRLAEVTGGAVLTDGLGELLPLRERLRWYPEQLWWWAMACQWQRVAEEEAFPGRCAEVGDDVGCHVLTARLVRDLVRLVFLQARRHAPYGKWLGTAFGRLPGSDGLGTALWGALSAGSWPEREAHLVQAYGLVAARHAALGLTEPLDGSPRPFHDRPYLVLDAGRFATALRARLTDPEVRALPAIGTVDQFVDSTAVLTDPRRARAVVRGAFPGREAP